EPVGQEQACGRHRGQEARQRAVRYLLRVLPSRGRRLLQERDEVRWGHGGWGGGVGGGGRGGGVALLARGSRFGRGGRPGLLGGAGGRGPVGSGVRLGVRLGLGIGLGVVVRRRVVQAPEQDQV